MSKSDTIPRIVGTLDEANSAIGLARSSLIEHQTGPHALNDADRYTLDGWLAVIQDILFRIGADVSAPPKQEPATPRINESDLSALEKSTDALDDMLPELNAFILPTGTPAAAALHLARAMIRRAEREIVFARDQGEKLNDALFAYVNRLSSYLFGLTRWINLRSGVNETHPHYGQGSTPKE